MPRFVDIQPGGEKYLAFALSKLRLLKAWMKPAGLRVMSKHYWVNPTDKIWIKALDLGNDIWWDWIRIEAGAEAHLVVRTDTHEWTFFSWDGFKEIEKFSAIGKPYQGSTDAPFGRGTQICAVAKDKIMVGTGTHLDNGTSQYWIVDAGGEHNLVAGPRPGSDFIDLPPPVTSSTTEGPWVCVGQDNFAHWSFGSHPGDPPFDGSGWVNTVVRASDFVTLSQNETNQDPDNAPVGPPAGWVLSDDSNTGYTSQVDQFNPARVSFSNPFTGNPKPDILLTPSSGKSSPSGNTQIYGTPNRLWRVVLDGGIVHVELCSVGGVKLASSALSFSVLLGWVVDDGQALIVTGTMADNKAWHVVEGLDGDGNIILTATDASSVGVLPYIRSKGDFWRITGQFTGWLLGAGIHLVNRQF